MFLNKRKKLICICTSFYNGCLPLCMSVLQKNRDHHIMERTFKTDNVPSKNDINILNFHVERIYNIL